MAANLIGIVSLLFTACRATPAEVEMSFERYVVAYSKQYPKEEYEQRKSLFEKRLASIRDQNAKPNALWTAGVNTLTDASDSEIRQLFGYNKALRKEDAVLHSADFLPTSLAFDSSSDPSLSKNDWGLQTDKDWRDHTPSVVTKVKDQGGCGSCWAFAATEVMESFIALRTGTLLDLAPQQLVDCTPNPQECGGSGGCSGATIQLAFNYTIAANGIDGAADYPYVSGDSGKETACDAPNKSAWGGISGYVNLPKNDAASLAAAVNFQGPIGVSVDADAWSQYHQGIFDGCSKDVVNINHAVVLMGYGQDHGVKYWLVRNSWGEDWGEKGYIRLLRYDSEPCGIDETPLEGTACKNGSEPPKPMVACGECGILFDSSFPLGAYVTDVGLSHDARRLGGPLHV